MKLNKLKAGLYILAVVTFTISCETENLNEMAPETQQVNQSELLTNKASLSQSKTSLPQIDENLGDLFIGKNAVEPSECGTTDFVSVQRELIAPLGKDLIAIFGSVEAANNVLSNYIYFNQVHSIFDTSAQYFGVNGEFTDFMNKRKLELEKFWSMPNIITLNGQHSATLNNKAELMKVLPLFYGPNAAAVADELLYINTLSPHIPESPFFAADGFATKFRGRNLIVIGDGIVTMLSETGIEEGIVWTGILAHEWAHQIQFQNFSTWYPEGAADNLPEATRYTELEADFLAAYYMTHKKRSNL